MPTRNQIPYQLVMPRCDTLNDENGFDLVYCFTG